MPIRKAHLNRAEQAKYRTAVQELDIAGVDVGVPEESVQDSLLLYVTVARSPASIAFDLPNGGVGYAICLRLVARQAPLVIQHCQITSEWDNQISMSNFNDRSPICRLGWLTYSRKELLNQGFDNSLRFIIAAS